MCSPEAPKRHVVVPEAPQYPLTPSGWHALRAGVWHRRRRRRVVSWRLWRLYQIAPAKGPPLPAYNVAASHSCWGASG